MVAAAIAAALVLALGQAASAAVTTHVSIAFNAGTARFHGSATSSNAECKSHRTVRLFKQTAGGPQLEGRTTTQTNGLWKVEVMHAHGHYYAVVPAQTVMNIHCGSARSGTVDVM
jgi:hypothetical protein